MLSGPQQQTIIAESVRPLSGNNQPERNYQTHTPIEKSNTDAMNEQVPRRLLPAYHEQQLEGASWASKAAFSPDGKLVAAYHQPINQPGHWNRDEVHFSLWDIATGRKQRFREFVLDIYGRAFSPDSSLIALCGYEKAGMWEVATGRAKWMLEDVSFGLFGFAFSPDGNLIAGACSQGTIRLWDVATGRQRRRLKSDSDESLELDIAMTLSWTRPYLDPTRCRVGSDPF
jgi:WD40 repeat protein